jgi:hypothetical protein
MSQSGAVRPVMSKAAVTVKVFGVYLVLLGVTLVLVPNLLLALFGIPATGEVWIRVVGLLAFNIGVYYWYAAKSEARPFFLASVFVRAVVPVVFSAFVALGLVSPLLILFGAVDLAGGLWTFVALRKEQRFA